ncbi:uncharacterized protein VTP21DRAFT_80 [Calcarisporiella thermophila]|uniref:uncharacterized protein n=1 Tax=Calcarisporiella thermophila TaxID=911321 RepID=UPI003742B095
MTSQTKYEVFYFKRAALSQPFITILEIVNADYTFRQVQDWNTEKATTPFGHLPVLYVTKPDGTRYEFAESQTISRYIGREYGLMGNTNEETALVEMVMDSVLELVLCMVTHYFFQEDEEKKEAGKKLVIENAHKLLPYHERLIKKFGGNGHYLDNKLTVADIHMFSLLIKLQKFFGMEEYNSMVNKDKTPELVKVFEAVRNEVGVKRIYEENLYAF